MRLALRTVCQSHYHRALPFGCEPASSISGASFRIQPKEKLRRDTLLYLTAASAALLPTFARARSGLPAQEAHTAFFLHGSSGRHRRFPEPPVSVGETSLDMAQKGSAPQIQKYVEMR
jgi:hypothetical protein